MATKRSTLINYNMILYVTSSRKQISHSVNIIYYICIYKVYIIWIHSILLIDTDAFRTRWFSFDGVKRFAGDRQLAIL